MNEPAGYYHEDLEVGMTAVFDKTVTEADVEGFAHITGDTNPVHLDEAYAATTPFGKRIAHGALSAALISTVLGTRLPGPGTIYMTQSIKFKAPVHIGDTVTTRATVKEIKGRGRARMETVCTVGDKVVAEGEALIMAPRRDG